MDMDIRVMIRRLKSNTEGCQQLEWLGCDSTVIIILRLSTSLYAPPLPLPAPSTHHVPRPSILQQRASRGHTRSSRLPWVTRVAPGAPSHTRASALKSFFFFFWLYRLAGPPLYPLFCWLIGTLSFSMSLHYLSVQTIAHRRPVCSWPPFSYVMPLCMCVRVCVCV